jgi:hypothetical protein
LRLGLGSNGRCACPDAVKSERDQDGGVGTLCRIDQDGVRQRKSSKSPDSIKLDKLADRVLMTDRMIYRRCRDCQLVACRVFLFNRAEGAPANLEQLLPQPLLKHNLLCRSRLNNRRLLRQYCLTDLLSEYFKFCHLAFEIVPALAATRFGFEEFLFPFH